ncbi:MAG TPA: HAMP domain-containing histidine kinase [Candidatus Blautia gallistercoris]|uniref:histidine kinase n=1 Tax=Candidatus Blautia gallistercoris TaxID=2838490 RepID=A0A9D1WHY1_9FIRM|nr:HAMP domain-containing histidine kinase [Candidatus Blautia gallistercoris]
MTQSIKWKITFWYTGILTIVLAVVLGSAFLSSEYYSIDNMKAELLDEVYDLERAFAETPAYLDHQDLPSYYDDGIMLSLYAQDGTFLNGILPDDFPPNVAFSDEVLQEISQMEDHWFLYDLQITDSSDTAYWIRGINSYSSIARMIQRLTRLLLILGPLLILFTAFIGYRMIRRALLPVSAITSTAREIERSSDLTKRITPGKIRDEFYDLTETFNEMLTRLEQVLQQEKQFSSDAAHELRTPVSVILGHCEYCLDELELTDEVREEISRIYQKASQMSRLVSQLLTISRAEQGYQLESEEIDLSVIAETVLEEMEEAAAARNIRLIYTKASGKYLMEGDMILLTRMLMNLVSNAIAYGKPGGTARIHLQNEGDFLSVSVEDDGIGIPREALDKIWNRFYRVDQSRSQTEGFGLGLFMVQWIVKIHNGTIQAESSYGKGSRFLVTLPVNRTK